MYILPKFNFKLIFILSLLVLFLGWYFGAFKRNDLGTYNDPKLAFKEFSKSMEMISLKFNKGFYSVNYLNEIENKASIVFKINKAK